MVYLIPGWIGISFSPKNSFQRRVSQPVCDRRRRCYYIFHGERYYWRYMEWGFIHCPWKGNVSQNCFQLQCVEVTRGYKDFGCVQLKETSHEGRAVFLSRSAQVCIVSSWRIKNKEFKERIGDVQTVKEILLVMCMEKRSWTIVIGELQRWVDLLATRLWIQFLVLPMWSHWFQLNHCRS